jgi:hypothetical protein
MIKQQIYLEFVLNEFLVYQLNVPEGHISVKNRNVIVYFFVEFHARRTHKSDHFVDRRFVARWNGVFCSSFSFQSSDVDKKQSNGALG